MHTKRMVLPTLLSLAFAAPMLASDVDPKPRAIKAKAFASGNAGFYTSVLGKPYVMSHAKYSGINMRLELNKKMLASMNAENNYGVIKETKLCYSACLKHERKFTGGHKTAMGENIRELLISVDAIPRNTYEENPLVELYEKDVPMYWQMTSADEFAAVRSSFVRRMQEKHCEPQKHAVLLVTLENDPTLASLRDEDTAFINNWFTQVSFEDGESREYFGNMFKEMNDQNYDLEGAKPEWPFETIGENLFRSFEKAFSEFRADRLIPLVAATMGGTIMATALTGPFKDAVQALAQQANKARDYVMDHGIDLTSKALERSGVKKTEQSVRQQIAQGRAAFINRNNN